MILNLNLSKLVNIGTFAFNIDELTYSHDLFIVEDSKMESKYYLVDIIKNITKDGFVDNGLGDILLEEVYIVDFSLKKDIPLQIISFLKEYGYIADIESARKTLSDVNISFFEVRYNFYENSRIRDKENISAGELYCNFSKVHSRKNDGTLGAIVEDMNLLSIKKMLYSYL